MSWALAGKAVGHVGGGLANWGKTVAIGGAISGAFHGFLGSVTYDGQNSDPLNQTKKMAGAWAVDNAVDAVGMAAAGIGGTAIGGVLGVGANVLGEASIAGRAGSWALKGAKVAGWGWMGASMAATVMGVDPSTLVQTAYDHLEQSYTKKKYGNGGINLSQSSSRHVQQQISNMMSSGNTAESMHNFKDNTINDYLQNNEQNKRKDICWANNKVARRKMASTYAI